MILVTGATIDPRDVAAVSARALTSNDHEARSYRLSGPDSLLPADRVRVLGDVLGRELRFEVSAVGANYGESSAGDVPPSTARRSRNSSRVISPRA
jgi:uncharacterized protein YbjT (DUF2867 family)